ncbi:MAG: hypothetical protein B7Y99_11255 [Caulobacterales bacterium 32-69-10]|nr:MAG: hypothetical protein B7Y99_11255 [Caulobacterales bacterium 32-69-10]
MSDNIACADRLTAFGASQNRAKIMSAGLMLMQHRRAVEFVASHPGLRGLDTDLIVAAAPGEPAAEKLAWARGELTADSAEVFAVEAEGLDEAVSLYRASRSADLIVVSRPVLLPSLRQRSRRIDENGMWGFRTPVLVC